jgi:hypothetical protein
MKQTRILQRRKIRMTTVRAESQRNALLDRLHALGDGSDALWRLFEIEPLALPDRAVLTLEAITRAGPGCLRTDATRDRAVRGR